MQAFPNSGKEGGEGESEILLGGGFLYWTVIMIWTFSKAKQDSVNTEHQLKKINLNIFI